MRPRLIALPENWIELCREYFVEKKGIVYWKKRDKFSPYKIGDIAGSVNPNGYVYIGFKRMRLLGHRVVWALNDFDFTEGLMLDHKNGVRHDNRIENLRQVNRVENGRNVHITTRSNTGINGISKCVKRGKEKYRVTISVDRKRVKTLHYDTLQEATHFRGLLEKKYFIKEGEK